jgi:hypothetical protein
MWVTRACGSEMPRQCTRIRRSGYCASMSLTVQVLGEASLGDVRVVTSNDSARSSFTVLSGDRLLALDAGLNVLAEWPAGSQHRADHATDPARGLALISAAGEVRLVDRAGRALWRHEHEPWSGDFERGCAWFDHAGDPYAVVLPPDDYDGCMVRRFDLASGKVLAEAPIEAAPAGIHPVHQAGGWTGLSEGEGQDAARAWWVRPRPGTPEFDLIDAGWDEYILADADPGGTRILTLPHGSTGPLLVRAFPALDIIGSFDPPDGCDWDFSACFAGELLIAPVTGGAAPGRLVAIDCSATHDLGESGGWLVPAADSTWLTVTPTTIRRCRAVGA